jgi:hypothetical protein
MEGKRGVVILYKRKEVCCFSSAFGCFLCKQLFNKINCKRM